jgi:hypothetical protein
METIITRQRKFELEADQNITKFIAGFHNFRFLESISCISDPRTLAFIATNHNHTKELCLSTQEINLLYEQAYNLAKSKFIDSANQRKRLGQAGYTALDRTMAERITSVFLTEKLAEYQNIHLYPSDIPRSGRHQNKLIIGTFCPDIALFGLRLPNEMKCNSMIIEVDGLVHEDKSLKDRAFDLLMNEVLGIFVHHIPNTVAYRKCRNLDREITSILLEPAGKRIRFQSPEVAMRQLLRAKLYTIACWLPLDHVQNQLDTLRVQGKNIDLLDLRRLLAKNRYYKQRLKFPQKTLSKLYSLFGVTSDEVNATVLQSPQVELRPNMEQPFADWAEPLPEDREQIPNLIYDIKK